MRLFNDSIPIPIRFVVVGLICFFAGRATTTAPRPVRASEVPALRAEWLVDRGDVIALEFATPLASLAEAAARDELNAAFAGAFSIEGTTEFVFQRESATRLLLEPIGILPRARELQLVTERDLPLSNGAALAKGARTRFTAPGPRVADLVPTQHGADGTRAFVLAFDLPVDLAALDAALHVRAASGDELARVIEPNSREETPTAEDVEYLRAGFEPGDIADPEYVGSRSAFLVTLPASGAASSAQSIRVEFDADLVSRLGPVALEGERVFTLDFAQRLAVESVQPGAERVVLEFNRDFAAPESGAVSIEPAVDFELRRGWAGELVLVGDFAPGSRYAVRLAAGFPGAGLARLIDPVTLPFVVPDREPALSFADDGIVLSTAARPELEVDSVNVATIVVRGKRVLDHNAVHFMRQSRGGYRFDPDPAFSVAARELRVPIAAPRNEGAHTRIDLTALLGAAPRGLYHVEVADADGETYPRAGLVAVTDLRVAARVAGESAIVAVSSLATGSPIAGATVELYSRTNRRLCEGTTDEAGFAPLRFAVEPGDAVFCAVAKSGDDSAIVDFEHFEVGLPDEFAGRDYLGPGQREAYVATDRPVVRPGEIAHGIALVRDERLRAAPGKVRLRVFDGAESRRDERTLEPSSSGLLTFDVATGVADPTGVWRVELLDAERDIALGETTFRVATITLPRSEVTLEPTGTFSLGSSAAFDVTGKWLGGAPLAGARATVSLRLDRVTDAIGANDLDYGNDEFLGHALRSIETALDAAGRARVEFDLPDCGRLAGTQQCLVTASVEVFEPDGRGVERTIQRTVAVAGPRVGLRNREGIVEIALVDAADRPLADTVRVNLDFYRDEWVWERDERGRARCDLRAVNVRSEVVEVVGGVGRCPLREFAGQAGLRVVATWNDRIVDLVLAAPPPPIDQLRVTVPTNPVARGARVPVRIESPVAGSAVLTLEGGGVRAAQRCALVEGINAVEFALPAVDLPPSMHLVASLALGQREVAGSDSRPLYLGSAVLAVEHAATAGEATVTAPPEVAPGDRFDVTVAAPGAAEAVVVAVDRGALFGQRSPCGSPLAHFLAPRRLDTRGIDSAREMRSRVSFDRPASPGGDADLGGLAAAIAEGTGVDDAVVSVLERVALDGAGLGRVTIDLSSFASYEGELAVLALASGTDRLGVGECAVRVAAPLSVRASGPRLLRAEDRAEFAVVVRNATGNAGEVTFEYSAAGGLAIGADAPRSLHLADGEQATLFVPLEVDGDLGARGSGEFTVHARLGSARRAATRPVAVVPRDPLETRHAAVVAEGGVRTTFDLGTGTSGAVRFALELDGRPQARLAAAESTLADYPHGCTEQVSSQLLARVGAIAFGAPAADGQERVAITAFADEAVRRIAAAQRPDGAFGFWSSYGEFAALPTLHATEALLTVRDEGFAVPADTLAHAVRWLVKRGIDHADPVAAATAAELASRAQQPTAAALARAAASDRREARSRAALGLARIGDVPAALAALAARPEPTADPAARAALFASSLRCDALELRALLLAAPQRDDVHDRARRLLDRLAQPAALTTNELAHGLLAARDYFRAFAPDSGPRTVTVTVGGERRTFEWPRERIEWRGSVPAGARIEILSDGNVFGRLSITERVTAGREVAKPELLLARELCDAVSGLPLLPGEGLRRGGVYRSSLRVIARRAFDSVVVIDAIPAGCDAERSVSIVARDDGEFEARGATPSRVELRDGLALFYFDELPEGETTLSYELRAVFRGEYSLPPARIEALYEVGVGATSGPGAATVPVRR